MSVLRIAWIYPDLLSTYGDRGNVIALRTRAVLRGIEAEIVEITSDRPVPDSADLYVIGGGEDRPQTLAAERLRRDGGLPAAAAAGRPIFGVCAGYQLLGTEFPDGLGGLAPGLGLLDVRSRRASRRAVGEILAAPDPSLGLPLLTGFENHHGTTALGSAARPLARTVAGTGNGTGTEGAVQGRLLGTYLHGPALVRNPALADLLLRWATGRTLAKLDDVWTSRLRQERLARHGREWTR